MRSLIQGVTLIIFENAQRLISQIQYKIYGFIYNIITNE